MYLYVKNPPWLAGMLQIQSNLKIIISVISLYVPRLRENVIVLYLAHEHIICYKWAKNIGL